MSHASEVSAARRHGQFLAEHAGFGDTDAGRLAIAITEAGTNILKHAGDGWLVLRLVADALPAAAIGPDPRQSRLAIEVLALDRGPGIRDLGRSLRDGVSTTGTTGTGLGAMRRLSDEFDVYSAPGYGTAVYMLVRVPRTSTLASVAPGSLVPPARLSIGAVCIPIAGEDRCGDAWGIDIDTEAATLLVADGLGHGPGAANASESAVAVLHALPGQSPTALMQAMHASLASTRGAAAAIARLEFESDKIRFVGVGNISACVLEGDSQHQLVSHNGIVGHNLRKVQEFGGSWAAGACCILCSDGIGTQWNLDRYPGLRACHPALIAGILYRDFFRVRDDATVVVVKRLR